MALTNVPGDAGEVRRLLTDARDVCRRLRIDEGARLQARGLTIRCPWHADRTPSCSVRRGDDGTIAVNCFACKVSGDVLDLVAVTNGLDCRRDFPEIMRLATDLAGSSVGRSRPPRPAPGRLPAREFPPAEEVTTLWDACMPVGDVAEVGAWLRSRALDVGAVDDFNLARALPTGARLPRWAYFQGRTWADVGYRCILPVFDHRGALLSLRARRIGDGDGPKALPPAGHRIGGLVMADVLGRMLLTTGERPDFWPETAPLRIVVAEGEPDFLTWGTAFSDADATAPAVIGVAAGSWTEDIAHRVPEGARVIVRTHHDEAGEGYARKIFGTFPARRVTLVRGGVRGCAACSSQVRGAA